MNRRTFLGLAPAVPFVPGDLAKESAAYVEQCLKRPDIVQKTIIRTVLTYDVGMVCYSDGSIDWISRKAYLEAFGG